MYTVCNHLLFITHRTKYTVKYLFFVCGRLDVQFDNWKFTCKFLIVIIVYVRFPPRRSVIFLFISRTTLLIYLNSIHLSTYILE